MSKLIADNPENLGLRQLVVAASTEAPIVGIDLGRLSRQFPKGAVRRDVRLGLDLGFL